MTPTEMGSATLLERVINKAPTKLIDSEIIFNNLFILFPLKVLHNSTPDRRILVLLDNEKQNPTSL